jgi:hypothetical protein
VSAAFAAAPAALLGRATTTHSVAASPLIYRAVSNVNDLDSVEGMAPPGSTVELWARQRNFIEGVLDDPTDPFGWCAWKNNGNPIWVETTVTGANGVWRLTGLRSTGNTIMLRGTNSAAQGGTTPHNFRVGTVLAYTPRAGWFWRVGSSAVAEFGHPTLVDLTATPPSPPRSRWTPSRTPGRVG